MLKKEALWLADRLSAWPIDRGIVLNVGSSSSDFRTKVQPWIEQSLLAPATRRGMQLLHQDLFPAPGVDIAGDLLSVECQARLAALPISGIICSNVLEHVLDRRAFATVLASLLPPGGRALVTVPHRFPLHPDPVDTGYRPDVEALRALFPNLRLVQGEILRCGRLLDLVMDNPSRLLRAKPASNEAPPPPTRDLREWLPYILRTFKMTCLELERSRDAL